MTICPQMFSRNISVTRNSRNVKLCTHIPDYLGAIVSKFDVNRIIGYVTVTSRTKTFPSKADTASVGYGGLLSRVTRVVAWLVRSFWERQTGVTWESHISWWAGGGRTVGVPIAATDNELITRDGGVGARNAGAAGIETRSTVGRKPADKSFKKRPGPSLL